MSYRTLCNYLKLKVSNFGNLKCKNCESSYAWLFVKYEKRVTYNHRTYCIYHSESLDSFTDSLVQEKGIKWSSVFIRIPDKYKHKLPIECLEKPSENLDDVSSFKPLDTTQILKFLRKCISNNNTKVIVTVLESCKDQNVSIPSNVLHDIAALFAIHGYKDGIHLAQNLCQSNNPMEFKMNANYMHYIAEAMWIQGNIQDSLKMFDQVYTEYPHKRLEVKIMLRRLFVHVIKLHGEASLVNITNFVIVISKQYCDFSLMAFLWKELFESEWFSDQQLAFKLQSKHKELTASINGMIPEMAKRLLSHHKLETFHRLIEVTLHNNMSKQTQFLLELLFEYKYAADDLQACSRIMETSIILDIPLKEDQCSRFIKLLLHKKKQLPSCDIMKSSTYTFKF